jgi:hypothetical protein
MMTVMMIGVTETMIELLLLEGVIMTIMKQRGLVVWEYCWK